MNEKPESDPQPDFVLRKKRHLPDNDTSHKKYRVSEDLPEENWFSHLTYELKLKILSCLSATDLTAFACVNRKCQSLASENVLWNRLYEARWTKQPVRDEGEHTTWKSRYFQKEYSETSEVLHSAQNEVSGMFKDLQKARRCSTLGPCSFEVIGRKQSPSSKHWLSEKVARWIKDHGFDCDTVQEIRTQSAENGPFVELDGVFICEKTGSVHVCNSTCSEWQSQSEKTCPISGHTVGFFLSDYGERSSDDAGDEEEDGYGRLGQAFAAGYNCCDDAEFNRMWGIS